MQRARQVLKNTVRGYITKDVGKRAASLTYYLLFAIFPFLVALISILGLLHLPMISLEGEAAAFLLSRKIYGFRLARLICEEKGQNTPC